MSIPPANNTKITNNTNPPDPPQIPRNTEKKGSQDEKMTSKTWSKNDANSSKNGPGGAQTGPKMDPKSRKKRSTHQNGTRWRP